MGLQIHLLKWRQHLSYKLLYYLMLVLEFELVFLFVFWSELGFELEFLFGSEFVLGFGSVLAKRLSWLLI